MPKFSEQVKLLFKSKAKISVLLLTSLLGISTVLTACASGSQQNQTGVTNQIPNVNDDRQNDHDEHDHDHHGHDNSRPINDLEAVPTAANTTKITPQGLYFNRNFNPISITNQMANPYGLTQTTSDFLANLNPTMFGGNATGLYDDLLTSFNGLIMANRNQIAFSNVQIENVTYKQANQANRTNEQIHFHDLISFAITGTLWTANTANVTIANHNAAVEPNTSYSFEITARDATILPHITTVNNNYFLGWKLSGGVTYEFHNAAFQTSLFPTEHSFSYVFPYAFDNLTTKQGYYDLYLKHNDQLPTVFHQSKLETLLSAQLQTQLADQLSNFVLANQTLQLLAKPLPIDQLLVNFLPLVNQLVQKLPFTNNPVTSFVQGLLAFLTSNDKGTSLLTTPLITFLKSHQSELLAFLQSQPLTNQFVNDYSLIITLLLNTDFSKDDTLVELVKSTLLDFYQAQFGGETNANDEFTTVFDNFLLNDFLGVNGQPKTLFGWLGTNLANIMQLFGNQIKANKTYLGLFHLFKLLFTPKDAATMEPNQTFSPYYETLLANETSKKSLVHDVLQNLLTFNEQISNIITALVVDNKALNPTNYLAAIQAIATFSNGIFGFKSENTTAANFQLSDFNNLTVQTKFVTNPSWDVQQNQISFHYQTTFLVNQPVTLDFKPIKSLIDPAALLKALPADTWASAEQQLSSLLKGQLVNLLANSSTLSNALLNFLPDTWTIGQKSQADSNLPTPFLVNDKKVENSPVYFNPHEQETNYHLGFSFLTHDHWQLVDEQFVKSLTAHYEAGLETVPITLSVFLIASAQLDIQFGYGLFYKGLLESLWLNGYDRYLVHTVYDPNTIIANQTNYLANAYATNLVINTEHVLGLPNDTTTQQALVNLLNDPTHATKSIPNKATISFKTNGTNQATTQHIEGKPSSYTLLTNPTFAAIEQILKINHNQNTNPNAWYSQLNLPPVLHAYSDVFFNTDFAITIPKQEVEIDLLFFTTKHQINSATNVAYQLNYQTYGGYWYSPIPFYDVNTQQFVTFIPFAWQTPFAANESTN